jgi:hypothetical protein
LCPAGTFGSRCAASIVNTLKIFMRAVYAAAPRKWLRHDDTKTAAHDGARSVRSDAGNAERYSREIASNGKFHFVLRAGNSTTPHEPVHKTVLWLALGFVLLALGLLLRSCDRACLVALWTGRGVPGNRSKSALPVA